MRGEPGAGFFSFRSVKVEGLPGYGDIVEDEDVDLDGDDDDDDDDDGTLYNVTVPPAGDT